LLQYNITIPIYSKSVRDKHMAIIVAGGAGGDGKTSVLELLLKYWGSSANKPVLGIDANPDQNLLSFMGVPDDAHPPQKICAKFDWLKESLEANNAQWPLDQIVDTTPVTPETRRWDIHADEDLIQQLAVHHHGVWLMETGSFDEEDLGGAGCYHSKVGPLTFMLQRLYDGTQGEDSITVVDNAHGRDAFGTTLYAQGDLILVVARPEKKSMDVLKDYLIKAKAVADKIGLAPNVVVIGNRLSNDAAEYGAEEQALKKLVQTTYPQAVYAGSLVQDPALIRKFENTGPDLDKILPENYRALTQIADLTLKHAVRDPVRRKQWMDFSHGNAGWTGALVHPDTPGQKSDYVPDADSGAYKPLRHVHGPHCKH